jgi:hypothetical protein
VRSGDEACCSNDCPNLAAVLGGFGPVIVLSYDGPLLFLSFLSSWRVEPPDSQGGALVSFGRTMDGAVNLNLYVRHAIRGEKRSFGP